MTTTSLAVGIVVIFVETIAVGTIAVRGAAAVVVALAAEMIIMRRTKDVVLVGANSFGKSSVGRRYKCHKTSNRVFIGHHHLLNSHRCGTSLLVTVPISRMISYWLSHYLVYIATLLYTLPKSGELCLAIKILRNDQS